MPTVSFRTLGCRLNQAETDLIAEDLIARGYEVVPESADPDVIIVNTCTVTQEATRGSRKTATKAVKDHPEACVVVAGCYAVAEPAEARALDGVRVVATNDDKDRLGQIISEAIGHSGSAPPRPLLQIGKRSGFPGADRTRVNLRVQTGCDEYCSFCIIPKTRGPLHSYPLEDLVSTARRKVSEGTRELVLTGVHLGKYGWDRGRPDDALVEMLEALLGIDGLARIRLSSILSQHLTDRVVGLMRDEPRLCRFLHVPLQAGDDSVLARMNRPYRMHDYLAAVERVKSSIPDVALSTDVIVGFPGETEEQFQRTVDVVADVRYMKLHVFRYSPRPGTPSAGWADQVPEPEKKRRSRELISLGNEIRREFHLAQVGRLAEVLVEERFDSGELSGHTDNFVRVKFSGDPALVDRLALVRVDEAAGDAVKGTFVQDVDWKKADPRLVGGMV